MQIPCYEDQWLPTIWIEQIPIRVNWKEFLSNRYYRKPCMRFNSYPPGSLHNATVKPFHDVIYDHMAWHHSNTLVSPFLFCCLPQHTSPKPNSKCALPNISIMRLTCRHCCLSRHDITMRSSPHRLCVMRREWRYRLDFSSGTGLCSFHSNARMLCCQNRENGELLKWTCGRQMPLSKTEKKIMPLKCHIWNEVILSLFSKGKKK